MRILTALLCPPISLLIANTADAFVPSTLCKWRGIRYTRGSIGRIHSWFNTFPKNAYRFLTSNRLALMLIYTISTFLKGGLYEPAPPPPCAPLAPRDFEGKLESLPAIRKLDGEITVRFVAILLFNTQQNDSLKTFWFELRSRLRFKEIIACEHDHFPKITPSVACYLSIS